MVLPITYPAAETTGLNADAINSWKKYKLRQRQKKPFNLNLGYTMYFNQSNRTVGVHNAAKVGSIRNQMVGYSPWYRRAHDAIAKPPSEWSEIENRLHGKLVSQWRSDASLGVSLAEGRQSWVMMVKRLSQLVSFGVALKRFDFKGAARSLGILKDPRFSDLQRSQKLRRGSRNFANNYLEFHFGWSPLLGDISDCMDVLSSEIPLGHYSCKSGTPKRPPVIFGQTLVYWKDYAEHFYRCFGSAGCDVTVTNPNLYLAASLGLTNPAVVAWELVPFSFVVDWFVGVNTFLESYSQWHGVKATNIYMTKISKCVVVSSYWDRAYSWQDFAIQMDRFVSTSHTMVRTTSLPQVTLKPKTTSLFEDKPRRALAACSLLIQQFVGKR